MSSTVEDTITTFSSQSQGNTSRSSLSNSTRRTPLPFHSFADASIGGFQIGNVDWIKRFARPFPLAVTFMFSRLWAQGTAHGFGALVFSICRSKGNQFVIDKVDGQSLLHRRDAVLPPPTLRQRVMSFEATILACVGLSVLVLPGNL